jgi:hypothetical protein
MAKSSKGAVAEELLEESAEELIEELKKHFAEKLSDKRIKLATVIFTVEGEEDPQLYRKGHFYDTSALLNHVLNAYRAKAAMELGIGGMG